MYWDSTYVTSCELAWLKNDQKMTKFHCFFGLETAPAARGSLQREDPNDCFGGLKRVHQFEVWAKRDRLWIKLDQF
jgi:hypothetical protein